MLITLPVQLHGEASRAMCNLRIKLLPCQRIVHSSTPSVIQWMQQYRIINYDVAIIQTRESMSIVQSNDPSRIKSCVST